MKRRQWKSQEKFQIVLEGLKERITLSELCAKYEISQSVYYKWRDQFLAKGTKAFEPDANKREARLETEVKKLKSIIGNLTIELKKKASTNYEKKALQISY